MVNEYSVWVMRPIDSLPERVRKSVEFHAENTQKEKNKNAFCLLYTYKYDHYYMMRVAIHRKTYNNGYFEVYSEGQSFRDYRFFIEENYHGDLYDHENCGMPLLFEIEPNKPFNVGTAKMILEKDPNPKDRLCNYFIIHQV